MFKWFLFAGMVLAMQLSAFAKIDEYRIKGKVNGMLDGIAILTAEDKREGGADTVQIKNGKFNFAGEVKVPGLYQITIPKLKGEVSFFLDNSNISIKSHRDSWPKADVKGSVNQSDKNDLDTQLARFYQLVKQKELVDQASNSKDPKKQRELIQELNSISVKAHQKKIDFVKTHPDSYYAAYLAWKMAGLFDSEQLVEITDGFSESLSTYRYMVALKKKVESIKNTQIGKIAPDFEVEDINNEMYKLSVECKTSTYLLIDFWASWCAPCRKENPFIVKAYEKFSDKGFKVVSVTMDKKWESWKKAVEEDKLIWKHVSGYKNGEYVPAAQYAVSQIPINFLLDKNRKIIAKDLRGEALIESLDKLFE